MQGDSHIELSLGHSPDADDAFMWWPLGTVGITAPAHLGELPQLPPVLDTGRFCFRPVALDIEALNRRAIENADLDITAMSFATYASATEQYILTSCGASFGEGYGPKILLTPDSSNPPPEAAAQRITHLAEIITSGGRIAIPGARTTAYLALQLMLREVGLVDIPEGAVVAVPFDAVVPQLLAGDVQAALVIHEAQVTYAASGLELLIDLGAWWAGHTGGLPLPLGANALRRDLDIRFGTGTLRAVAALLGASITHALAHRAPGLAYAARFAGTDNDSTSAGAPTMTDLDRFVGLYVNELSVDCGARGRDAVEQLLREGREAGLLPPASAVDMAPSA